MKVVSKVKLEWIEEKMKLFKRLETVNLNGDDENDADKDDNDSKQKETEIECNDDENTMDDVMDGKEEKRRRKVEAIEAARQRALSRRSLNPDS
jgi:hypothetical protein